MLFPTGSRLFGLNGPASRGTPLALLGADGINVLQHRGTATIRPSFQSLPTAVPSILDKLWLYDASAAQFAAVTINDLLGLVNPASQASFFITPQSIDPNANGGVIDARSAIQAACVAAAGRTVLLNSGTYLCSPTVISNPRTRIIIGQGATVKWKPVSGPVGNLFSFTAPNCLVDLYGTVDGNRDAVVAAGGTAVYGQSAFYATPSGAGFVLDGHGIGLVKNSIAGGVLAERVANITIRDTRFTDLGLYAILFGLGGGNGSILNNDIVNCRSTAIGCYTTDQATFDIPQDGLLVQGNKIDYSQAILGARNPDTAPFGVEIIGPGFGPYCGRRVRVLGNYIKTPITTGAQYVNGISLENMDLTVCADNIVIDGADTLGMGFEFEGGIGSRAVMANNTVTGGLFGCLIGGGHGPVMTGNVFKSTYGPAIQSGGAATNTGGSAVNAVISGNIFDSCGITSNIVLNFPKALTPVPGDPAIGTMHHADVSGNTFLVRSSQAQNVTIIYDEGSNRLGFNSNVITNEMPAHSVICYFGGHSVSADGNIFDNSANGAPIADTCITVSNTFFGGQFNFNRFVGYEKPFVTSNGVGNNQFGLNVMESCTTPLGTTHATDTLVNNKSY